MPGPSPGLLELAITVADGGVKEIDGDIVADDSRYPYEPYGPDWTVDDIGGEDALAVSAWMAGENTGVLRPAAAPVYRDPALAIAEEFRQLLIARGVFVRGQARAHHRQPDSPWIPLAGVVLAERTSPPLRELLRTLRSAA